MRCKDGFRGDFEDRGKVNGGRIKERASRGDKRGSRLKFLPKADKIISRQKSPLCLTPVWERKRKAAIQV